MVENNQGLNRGTGRMRGQGLGRHVRGRHFRGQGSAGKCVCPECGHEENHRRGKPCYQEKCSECGASLIRN